MIELRVVRAGWATTVQDAGRPGFGSIGVSPSGALDAPVRRLLNRLVGNPEDAAVLETLGGLVIEVAGPALIATSAELAPRAVGLRDTVAVEPAAGAMWAYVAVRGGLLVDEVLGSRSIDSRSGLGPAAIVNGAHLPIGPDPATPIVADFAARAETVAPIVHVHRGPRADWFVPGTIDELCSNEWTVTSDVSRVGLRLDGRPLHRRLEGELSSEGVLLGAIQVPPDGRPVVMLNDHPTTGGYPVLAVVDASALPVIVQSRPGATVRFRLLQ